MLISSRWVAVVLVGGLWTSILGVSSALAEEGEGTAGRLRARLRGGIGFSPFSPSHGQAVFLGNDGSRVDSVRYGVLTNTMTPKFTTQVGLDLSLGKGVSLNADGGIHLGTEGFRKEWASEADPSGNLGSGTTTTHERVMGVVDVGLRFTLLPVDLMADAKAYPFLYVGATFGFIPGMASDDAPNAAGGPTDPALYSNGMDFLALGPTLRPGVSFRLADWAGIAVEVPISFFFATGGGQYEERTGGGQLDSYVPDQESPDRFAIRIQVGVDLGR